MKTQKRLKQCIWKPKDAKDCWQLPEAGEKHREDSPSEPLGGTKPDSTLTLDLWYPELWGNTFLLFHVIKIVEICYSSRRKLIQMPWLREPSIVLLWTGATCQQPIQPPRSHARLRHTCPLPGNICLLILNVLGNVQATIISLQLNSLESMWLEKITSPRLKI